MNDPFNKTTADIRLRSPATLVITGPTGCGKTRLIMRLIALKETIAVQQPSEIIYCYGEWQPLFESYPDVTFIKGMLDYDHIPNDGQHRWLIIDDLMSEVNGKEGMNNLFTKGSHHKNLSVFFLTQNYFGGKTRTLAINAQYVFMMKSPIDTLCVRNLARQAFPGKSPFVIEAFERATQKPHSHLLFVFRQETESHLRLIGNFASDRMTVYTPSLKGIKSKRVFGAS